LNVTIDLQVDFDGTGYLFVGGAGEQLENGASVLYLSFVAGWTTRFLALLGSLYESAHYFGTVDIGVALVGMQGRIPDSNNIRIRAYAIPYERDEYRRTSRASAFELKDEPSTVSRGLVMPLFDTMLQGLIDPFKMS
jgi:hypothetical protein